EKAGLKVGDIIKKIDGISTTGLDANELIDSIKGPSGTTVQITVDRNGQLLDFSIVRGEITLETVLLEANSTTEVPDTIGYIAIYQFTGSTGADFDDMLSKTMAKNPKGLILDLRDNPGGYVEAAYEVLEQFVPKGETLAEMKISGKIIDELSQAGSTVTVPMAVLVNEGTASSSEIVAGALQDHGLATLIGEQTYGKGTVQEVTVFTDGSFFKLSIAQWLTPDGHSVDNVGLTPDIIAKPTKDDVLGKTDSQLQRAIDELS
ncbi:MAG TPA: S41 family peptidase, partial [Candidatus Gracilibacteria bacterium]|nr:S41 family peptidase [Candidatus Gracilibacteria bacterium]